MLGLALFLMRRAKVPRRGVLETKLEALFSGGDVCAWEPCSAPSLSVL